MAGKTKTDLESILACGVDLSKRRIYFGNLHFIAADNDKEEGGEFNWSNVEVVIRQLHILSHNSHKPIELYMSSDGGCTMSMLRLYDAIQECPCQIKFYGSGIVASSAAYIMAGCDERYLSKNTKVMVHKGSGGVNGGDDEVNIQIAAEENKRLTKMLNQILADNSRMDEEYWDMVKGRDVWLTPEECIMLGIADKIIEPKKRGNLRRSRIARLNKDVDQEELQTLVQNINNRVQLPSNSINISMSVPKERFDKDVYVDDTPEENENDSEQVGAVDNQPEDN